MKPDRGGALDRVRMLERPTLILIASVTLLVPAAPVAAQTEDASFDLIAATRDLDAGSRVRFETRSAGVGYGTFMGAEPAALLWADSGGESARIDAEDLLRLEVERSAWRRGAKIGGTWGAVLGAVFLVWANHLCEGLQPGCGEGDLGAAVDGGIFFGLVGGGVGAAIGSAFQEWHTIYPAGAP
jgi:hypothetical protein